MSLSTTLIKALFRIVIAMTFVTTQAQSLDLDSREVVFQNLTKYLSDEQISELRLDEFTVAKEFIAQRPFANPAVTVDIEFRVQEFLDNYCHIISPVNLVFSDYSNRSGPNIFKPIDQNSICNVSSYERSSLSDSSYAAMWPARKAAKIIELREFQDELASDDIRFTLSLLTNQQGELAVLGHVDKRRNQRRMDVISMKPRKLSAVLS